MLSRSHILGAYDNNIHVLLVWDNSLKYSFSKKATTFKTILDLINVYLENESSGR